MPPPFPPGFALVGGIFAVSTGAIFARLADAPALVTSAYRVGIAVLVMSPVCLWLSRRQWQHLTLRDIQCGAAAGLFLAFHFIFWISSLSYTSVANSVVLVNTNPLWVGILTPLITRERIPRFTKIGIGLSVIGGIVIGYGDFATGTDALFGDALALAGGVCAAVYLLLGRNLRKRISVSAYVMVCYGSAALVLWLLVMGYGQPVSGFSSITWMAFVGMALVAQVIGHTSYNWALGWVSPSLVAVSLLGEPVCASVMAYFLFGEAVTIAKFIGGGIILLAIYLSTKGEMAGTA